MRFPNPYTAGAGLLVLLLIFGGILRVGHSMGVKAEANRSAPVIEKLKKDNESLTLHIRELDAAIREANGKVAEEAARAEQQQAKGLIAVTEAKAVAKEMKTRVSTLERTLQRERSTCTEAEMKICGVPLR